MRKYIVIVSKSVDFFSSFNRCFLVIAHWWLGRGNTFGQKQKEWLASRIATSTPVLALTVSLLRWQNWQDESPSRVQLLKLEAFSFEKRFLQVTSAYDSYLIFKQFCYQNFQVTRRSLTKRSELFKCQRMIIIQSFRDKERSFWVRYCKEK